MGLFKNVKNEIKTRPAVSPTFSKFSPTREKVVGHILEGFLTCFGALFGIGPVWNFLLGKTPSLDKKKATIMPIWFTDEPSGPADTKSPGS